jgi:Bor protein
MRKPFRGAAALLVLSSAACFHQIVNTGLPAGTTTVNRPWTSTFIYGLVPAKDINVMRECPNGIATVETQQSFANGLVGLVTLGIYTPQDVRVTCASGAASIDGAAEVRVSAGATVAEQQAQVGAALEQAARDHRMLVVRF